MISIDAGPFEPNDRRLRYDVLCLAHRLVVDDLGDTDNVVKTAEWLMAFIDGKVPAPA